MDTSDILASDLKPLVVDLDGTLVRTDLLHESFFNSFPYGLKSGAEVINALFSCRALLKYRLAEASRLDYSTLPYDNQVLDQIRAAKEEGRQIFLATASDAKHARAICDHLGVFDGWFASDGKTNLSAERKAAALVAKFGENGFDYIGNGAADMPVWERADKAYAVGLSSSQKGRLRAMKGDFVTLQRSSANWKIWLKALRYHQYVKNLLIFVPLLTSHQFNPATILKAVIAFVGFCACASAVYILNDLLDLQSDRAHPRKRNRPFASGALSLSAGMIVCPALLLFAAIVALQISREFFAALAGYFVLTTAYSLYLKRKMLVDVVVLAMLYAARIVAGGVAAGIPISQWLFIFSIFMFTSLALIKRYVELSTRLDRGLPERSDRNYRVSDLDIVAALAAAAGMNAITIFSLYVTSPDVQVLYRNPKALWLICPILLYWIGRALMMAHRRHMDDDPIVFALRDRISMLAIATIVAIVIFAM
ncbi:UbiA family prenyltransferase [Bradyrhizobium sp. STM 3557]|uniref:UbiA family prenyltransferase n=1 Tax=Bradyrhizobium sp. STM 3557 TaxID=578920 RepID=UPI00388D4833